MPDRSTTPPTPERTWPQLAVLLLLVVDLAVLMEWLFFVTKPSFLSVLDGTQRLVVLGLTPLPFLVLFGTVQAPFLVVLARARSERVRKTAGDMAELVPSIVLGFLFLLLLDNFANTMFGISIERVPRPWSLLLGGVLAVCVWLADRTMGWCLARMRADFSPWARSAAVLGSASVVLLVGVMLGSAGGDGSVSPLYEQPAERPNIVLLGSDGLNADHLSCYGHERDTTPYLAALAPRTLFCENAFANCSHTTGSLASLLTGRLPTELKITYPPDILTGPDVFRHLPGLLKKFGYGTTQISIRHYGDAYDLNLREGFDSATFRTRGTAQAGTLLSGALGMEASYFAETILDRVRSRLLHILGLRSMPSAYEEATAGDRLAGHSDGQRFRALEAVLRTAPEPFFVHTHLMGTHGARFNPTRRVFSASLEQDRGWITEFYEDAILDFDVAAQRVMELLHERGVLGNTLVVFYSDHGMASDSRHRTLLMFHFPSRAHAGRIRGNVQLVDVAPTILDHLGAEVPDWMNGRSLLAGTPDPRRPVFSTRFREDALERVVARGPFKIDRGRAGPPFYSMGSLFMIVGQRVHSLDLAAGVVGIHDLPDHTAPLVADELPSSETVGTMLVEHLAERGYDVSGLPRPLPVEYRH